MSNEATLAQNLSFTKNGDQRNFRPRTINPQIDVAGAYSIQQTFTIGTTDTVIDLENVGTPGYIMFHNLDLNSDIQIGGTSGNYPIMARKGGNGYGGPVEWNGAAIHMIASAGNADIEMLILPK